MEKTLAEQRAILVAMRDQLDGSHLLNRCFQEEVKRVEKIVGSINEKLQPAVSLNTTVEVTKKNTNETLAAIQSISDDIKEADLVISFLSNKRNVDLDYLSMVSKA